jgi:inner membrane protein
LDTLTHIVLGACIGEATAGKALGKKALFLGAFAQSAPDFDFIAHFWLEKSNDILSHRGITHSLLFVTLVTILLAEVSKRIFPTRPNTRVRWWLLFGINLYAHIFIDSFNAYGTGWFEPFSSARISFHVLFVADPFFSIAPFIAFIFLIIARISHGKRQLAWKLGIGISTVYLLYAIGNKLYVDRDIRKTLSVKGISTKNYFITPTPLTSWLWFIVAEDTLHNGFYTGYRSVFDKNPTIPLTWIPKNDSLTKNVQDKHELNNLKRFSRDYYTIQNRNDTLIFNVLRFGQVMGWENENAEFAFHYYLDKPGANEAVTQRGRLKNWNRQTVSRFVRRIRGGKLEN